MSVERRYATKKPCVSAPGVPATLAQTRKRFYSVASERVVRSLRRMVVSVEPAPLWSAWASQGSITASEAMKPSNVKPSYWS
jgi:hypothetical protein